MLSYGFALAETFRSQEAKSLRKRDRIERTRREPPKNSIDLHGRPRRVLFHPPKHYRQKSIDHEPDERGAGKLAVVRDVTCHGQLTFHQVAQNSSQPGYDNGVAAMPGQRVENIAEIVHVFEERTAYVITR